MRAAALPQCSTLALGQGEHVRRELRSALKTKQKKMVCGTEIRGEIWFHQTFLKHVRGVRIG